jgi:hypothetical protein
VVGALTVLFGKFNGMYGFAKTRAGDYERFDACVLTAFFHFFEIICKVVDGLGPVRERRENRR